jgi:preprotein translocase subunit SecF
MQWLSRTPNFNFVKYRRVAMVTSTTLSLLAIISIFYPGLNYGLDFTGGILVEARFAAAPELDKIRAELSGGGFEDTQVTGSGADVLIRLPPPEGVEGAEPSAEAVNALRDRVLDVLRAEDPDVTILRADNVGGQVGAELFENAGLALLFALIMIFIYVMLRFRWKLAVGAIVATVHDVLVTTGIFAIAGWQFDLTVLGSILAVLGYSINDTIVVYDRIRDNFRLMRRGTPEAIVNASMNQTLARTLVTGVTTLLVLFAMIFLAGETLWGFSVALVIGIVVGTYSSIYVASSMALVLKVEQSDFVEAKKVHADELP